MKPAYEHNGHAVSRQAFYRIACDPRRSVAVEACAGAGKTWMLVSRILRALLDGAAPHEILAITFTKKAAGEMRQRLVEWLQAFAAADDAQLLNELVARGVDPQQAPAWCEPLRQLYPRLLGQGRQVQIRTFHSWFAALLRTAPLSVLETLGLPAAYELLEDDTPACEQVWRPFLAQLLQTPQAREDYQALVAAHGRFQAERALMAALQRRVEFALADAQGRVEASVPHFHEVFTQLQALQSPMDGLLLPACLERLQQAARVLGRASQPSFSAKGSALEQAITARDAAGVVDALFTQAGGPRKFSDKLDGIDQVRAAQEEVTVLQQADAQHQAWLHQQRMTRLTRLLVQEFAQLKRQRGWVDMNDVERAAQHLLSDPVLGGWVQERLDARTRHLLIDEFQDTSPLQWQALRAWLSGYGGAGGGGEAPSLFIVGDPKQSIYRFRRAEPQVFIAAQAFVRDLGGEQLSCDHTRRNAPEVLGLVNQTMAQAQAQGEYEGFRDHSTESAVPGAVLALPAIERAMAASSDDAATAWRDSLSTPRVTPEEGLRTLECRQAAHWLAGQIQAGIPARQIMVLARKRERLSHMQQALLALGIAAQQPEKTDLGEAPEVQDVVALLDVLVSPTHDLSLARALKSPLFGLDDEALVPLALRQRQASAPSSWLQLLQQPWDASSALQGVGAVLQRWKHWVDTLPPHDALDAIYEEGDVLARFAAAAPAPRRAAVLSNLQALLVAALQHDGGRYATPYGLVRALKSGGVPAPAVDSQDAVQLLTVHGAKGLEASVVLLLDTDAQEPPAQSMAVLIDWPGQAEVPRQFIFLSSESRVPPSARHAMEMEQRARQREELNALYVAMTRARQTLVLSSVQPRSAQEGSWWQRLRPGCSLLSLSGLPQPSGELMRTQESGSGLTLPVLPTLSGAAVPAAGSPAAPLAAAGETADSLASRLGQAMHRLLEWAALDATGWSESQIQYAGAEFGLDATESAQAAAMALRILTGEGAWAWHAQALAWHANEVPVIVQGSVRRIDRLVRRKADSGYTWWVLDYKSAASPQAREDLRAQLHDYRDAVRQAASTAGEPVYAAFLSSNGHLEVIE